MIQQISLNELPSKPILNHGRDSIVMSPDSSDSDRKRSASSGLLKVLKGQELNLRNQNISGGITRMPISDNDSGEGAICLEDFVGVTNP